MLTSVQREKCHRIAEALDAGDLSPWRKGEASLSAEERGEIWDLRRQHAVAVGQRHKQAIARRPATAISSAAEDLDFWADDESAEPDDPDDDGQPCEACHGTGRDSAGNVCEVCQGTGKAPDSDDEENEDNFEKKSVLYEFQEE